MESLPIGGGKPKANTLILYDKLGQIPVNDTLYMRYDKVFGAALIGEEGKLYFNVLII